MSLNLQSHSLLHLKYEQMKRLLMFILPLALITIVSCKKDVTRDDFAGTWNATDSYVEANGTTITSSYTFTVANSSTAEDKISISNFGKLMSSAPVEATVSGNKFTLPTFNITIDSIGSGTFSGNGSLEDDELTYTYAITAPGFTRTYNGKAKK